MTSTRLPTTERSNRPSDCPDAACGAPLDLPYLCNMCGTLLRPPPCLTHFERFGLEPTLGVDPADLEQRYLDLTRRLHPDRMIGRDAKTQNRALLLSSALNQAYAQLSDERLRAEHLLEIKGGKTAEEDKRTPQAFLLEILDLREEVEAAQAADDTEALARFAAQAEREREACLERVRAAFADPAFPTPALLEAIRQQLNVVKYWVTLTQDLEGVPSR